MERLAQAAQVSEATLVQKQHLSFCNSLANFALILHLEKSEVVRFPDVTQRTLLLFDEVSRKRELFEKEQQTGSAGSSGGSRQVQLSKTTL